MTKIPAVIQGAPYSYLMEGNAADSYKLFLRAFVPKGKKIIWDSQPLQNENDPEAIVIQGVILDETIPIQSSPWALIPIDGSMLDPAIIKVSISVINGHETKQDTIYFEDADPVHTNFNGNQVFNSPYMYLFSTETAYNTPSKMYVPRCCFLLKGKIVDREFTIESQTNFDPENTNKEAFYLSEIFIEPNPDAAALEIHSSLLYPNHVEYYDHEDESGSFAVNIVETENQDTNTNLTGDDSSESTPNADSTEDDNRKTGTRRNKTTHIN